MNKQLILLSEQHARALWHGWAMLTVQANNDEDKAIYVEGLEEAQAILKDFFGVDLNG